MDDDEIQRIAESLRHSVRRDGKCRLSQGKPWPWLTLNRERCILFASNLLRLASKPLSPNHDDVTQQLSGLEQVHEVDTDLEIFLLRRVESFDCEASNPPTATTWRDRMWLIGCGMIAFLLCAIFASGLWFWARLIFG